MLRCKLHSTPRAPIYLNMPLHAAPADLERGWGNPRVRVHLKLPPYRALSRRRPGTYFSIKHLHKTFTAYGARMQCKSFIVRIGRILRILSATPTPAHYSMPGNTLLPAAACPRGPMPAWILSIFINLIHGKQQQQAQLV